MIDFFKKLMEQALDLELTARFTERDGEWSAALGDELDSLSLEESEEHRTELEALIWEGDRSLICQRPAHKVRGLLWEFVSGKVEPGETKEQALICECREELAVALSVGDVSMEVDEALAGEI